MTHASCLKKTLGRAYTTFEELQTILCEVEVAINSRPLAYVSDDDLDEPLTPLSPNAWTGLLQTDERHGSCVYGEPRTVQKTVETPTEARERLLGTVSEWVLTGVAAVK